MTAEITALALAGLLQGVQLAVLSVRANRELGRRKTLSPRDGMSLGAELGTTSARMLRALNNHFEGLVLFALAVVVVTLSDASTGFTALCAWTYLFARLLYVPAYVFGLVPWRSVVWSAGFLATMAMILSALVG